MLSKGVQNPSVMACLSACMEMNVGRIQTGDMSSELNRPQKVNLATAPGSRDGAYEVHGTFHAQPTHARLHDRDPARKRSTSDTSRPCGRRKCRRVLCEFGTDGSPCEHVCEAPHAAQCKRRARNAWRGSTGRYARAGLHGKPRRFGVQVTSSARTSRRELRASGARWLAWRTPRRRVLIAMRRATTRPRLSAIGRDERVSRRPPLWRCKKKKKKKPLSKSMAPAGM